MRKILGLAFVALVSAMTIISLSNLSAATRGIQITVRTSHGKDIELYRESYALIIGNGNYSKGWDPLPGAIRDVKEVAEVLRKNGFKVTLKTNLTRIDFYRVLGEFVLRHGGHQDNRLLFYYAGHGHTRPMATGEQLGYLVMVDSPAPEKDPLGFSLSSVDMQSLVTQAKMIKAKHVLFLFDSCFSGTVLNLRERVTPKSISDNVRFPVRQFITAGRANEPVPDHSVFKQAFLDLLEGRVQEPIADGYLTGEELGLYLKNTVPEYNPTQHPQYGKIRDPRLDKGDFVFVRMEGLSLGPTEAERTKLEVEKLSRELSELKKQLELEKLQNQPQQTEQKVAKSKDREGNTESAQSTNPPEHGSRVVRTEPQENLLPETKLAYVRKEHARLTSEYKGKYRLAIFPWLERRDASRKRDVFVEAVNQAVDKSEVFVPVFSFYDLKNKYRTKVIKDVMSNYPAKELFTRSKALSFSLPEPQVDLIAELGGELEVDAVLIGRLEIVDTLIYGRENIDTTFEISIIDVNTKRQYALRDTEVFSSTGDLRTSLRRAFVELFAKYRSKKNKIN